MCTDLMTSLQRVFSSNCRCVELCDQDSGYNDAGWKAACMRAPRVEPEIMQLLSVHGEIQKYQGEAKLCILVILTNIHIDPGQVT